MTDKFEREAIGKIHAEPALSEADESQTFTFSEWKNVKPQEAFENALSHHLIVIHTTPNPVMIHERADSTIMEGIVRSGDINVLSAGEMSVCRWEDDLSFFRMELASEYMRDVADKADISYRGGALELQHRIRTRDEKMIQIAHWLRDTLQNGGAANKLYLDSLGNLLTLHLLQNYTSMINKPQRIPNALTEPQISRTVDYMRAHLESDISLEELSKIANASPSHLVRLFKQATGYAPHQYLIRLRVEQAKLLLLSKQLTISEVAAAVGFADQSHLHRHFKRTTGYTPREFLISR